MLKCATVKERPTVGTENSRRTTVNARIVMHNHESRPNKASDETLLEIAKRCYPEYVSPYKKEC
jgi:hypothetical protein